MTELRASQLTAEQASRIIVADIRAYPKDGPDKREEHLQLFGALLSREVVVRTLRRTSGRGQGPTSLSCNRSVTRESRKCGCGKSGSCRTKGPATARKAEGNSLRGCSV